MLDGYLYYHSINKFICSYIENELIDLIDVHWLYPDAYAAIKWAKKFKKKIIITVRGHESIYYYSNSMVKKFIPEILTSSDHIISVSSDLKNKIINQYKIHAEKISVISNGIDTEKFFLIDQLKAKKLCGLEESKKYILAIGRLSYEKGMGILLESFSLLNEQDTELIIIGAGFLKTKLVNLANHLNIIDRVKFIQEVAHDKAYLWYNSANVFCLPSRWEGCPNVVIESLACGTPVVATKVGAVPDIMSSSKLGIIVPPEDSSQLVLGLRDALQKKWDADFISQVGSQNNWDTVAHKVNNVFEKILN